MAIKDIIRMGNPILRNKNNIVSKEFINSDEFSSLINDMRDTMADSGGIGIAAPQIGVNKQIAIIAPKQSSERYDQVENDEDYIICNPKIEILDPTSQGYWEGCLSLPGLRGYVERPKKIRLTFLDENTNQQVLEIEDFLAVIFQHEIDHLFGRLYIDLITDKNKISYEQEYVDFHCEED